MEGEIENNEAENASIILHESAEGNILRLFGDIDIENVQYFYQSSEEIIEKNLKINFVDISQLKEFDTTGAYIIRKILGKGEIPSIKGIHDNFLRLLAEIDKYIGAQFIEPKEETGLALVGKRVIAAFKTFGSEFISTINFIGATIYSLFVAIISPQKVRWTQTIAVAETAGFNAIPIVSMLSFFIGLVITIMGAQTLQSFGVTVFVVDLLGMSVLREFAVLITAIILAGRSASAFTAQLGSMKMTQEVDAMSVIGLDPMENLVIPRVIAMMFMMPILVFFAMIAGLIGGGLIAITSLDMSFIMFTTRLQEAVGVQHFWVGMAKVPIMAFIISIIGCRQGLQVENDVVSLGKNTTASVVQAIFMVIVIDAIFAMIYNELEI